MRTGNMIKAIGLAGIMLVTLTGCDSGTVKPLCPEATGGIEGITGVYTLNMRGHDFSISQSTFSIIPDSKSKNGSFKMLSDDGSNDEDTTICNIGGVYVMEKKDKDVGYSQGRLYISQVGLHFVPNLFDKAALDAAGIPNKILVIPARLRSMMGDKLATSVEQVITRVATHFTDDDSTEALQIDNTSVPAVKLVPFAKPASYGFTLYRE